MRPVVRVLLAWLLCCSVPVRADEAPSVTFDQDVMAVLSKAGCNWGACHANANGKGGLKLSLRGEDPQFDFDALVRQHQSRRVNLIDPDASLILQKPSGKLPHQGGVRFSADSPEYQTLRAWLAAGAPGPGDAKVEVTRLEVSPLQAVIAAPEESVTIRAVAHYSDGSSRDVSRLAVYETTTNSVEVTPDGTVRRIDFGETTVIVRYLQHQIPVRLAFIEAASNFEWSPLPAENFVDEHIDAKLRQLRVAPSPVCDDATFVRRAYLDVLGLLPTADEARSFVESTTADKRKALVDQLLQRPEFAEHFALKWSDLLRNEEKVLDPRGVDTFHAWIRDSIAAGKPMDQFVREILSARGSTYEHPPANFYRAVRDPTSRGETVARLFLGVRLQCARCHNHPFDRWTQDDYYSWSAVFARIDYKIIDNKKADKLDLNAFDGEQIVLVTDKGELKNARTGKDAQPILLGASPLSDEQDRLEQLAAWTTSPENELFVKSQVNFVWYHLMGRGLVEPLDDFRLTNPPTNPELLDALARDFVASGFDLRHLIRTIMSSRAYQASALPNETNEADENYSRAILRRLPAETLLDAQCQVLDAPTRFQGYPVGTRAGQVRGINRGKLTSGDRFLRTFGKPERLLACECERSNETTLKQAFVLIGDEDFSDRLKKSGNRLDRLAKSDLSPSEIVDELYWTALSRAPSEDERRFAEAALASSDDRFAALQDLTWALLNSKEFLFRH